uniref:Uncharacterized protein n=1 Tax=Utricularia reniformis TaxID=192314 RepID=A0A1Y0B3G5_9LAMI|nr:hypothetical protein AEK19_MT1778 [Utricularia reniformis]ART31951.1 hypothetical protein AEK19_MT1778 [Utricularia reniformis]
MNGKKRKTPSTLRIVMSKLKKRAFGASTMDDQILTSHMSARCSYRRLSWRNPLLDAGNLGFPIARVLGQQSVVAKAFSKVQSDLHVCCI